MISAWLCGFEFESFLLDSWICISRSSEWSSVTLSTSLHFRGSVTAYAYNLQSQDQGHSRVIAMLVFSLVGKSCIAGCIWEPYRATGLLERLRHWWQLPHSEGGNFLGTQLEALQDLMERAFDLLVFFPVPFALRFDSNHQLKVDCMTA